ncbi:ATP-binding protein [Sphaerimonospora cavernae]|uniref:ATP-binding protein n=1 Tax=Sphaerimonospora cavernae TaxID=1740611 RepID=A0ABV6U0M9_9ACTN
MNEVGRRIRRRVERSLNAFRVVIVTGPRQCGKTTLVRQILADRPGTFRSLDDSRVLAAALVDPAGFVQYGAPPRAIDEIQFGGDALVRSIKFEVDREPKPGQYLLTGSTDFLTVPGLSESLAGRAVLLDLWPFSQGELHGTPDGFVDVAFRDPESLRQGSSSKFRPLDYLNLMCAGGYPEAVKLETEDRTMWFDSLIQTITQRDVADLTGARRAAELPRLLAILAARTASELVVSQINADFGLARHTTEDYIGFLRMTNLIREVPPWATSHATRAKRRRKIHLTDTGMVSHLLGADADALLRPEDRRRGPLTETFVVNELRKQLTWSSARAELLHFRDHNREIDVILETPDARVVAIEIKSGLTVDGGAFRHLADLRDKLGDAFVHGFVVGFGETPLPFGDRLTSIPLSYLWEAG